MERELKSFTEGQSVHYIPFEGADDSLKENGVVKSIGEDPNYVFVVFKCNGEWHNYKEYTGQRVKTSQLKEGWNY